MSDKGSDLGLFSLPWHSLANVWRALNGTPEPVSLDPRRNPEFRERCWTGTKRHLSGMRLTQVRASAAPPVNQPGLGFLSDSVPLENKRSLR